MVGFVIARGTGQREIVDITGSAERFGKDMLEVVPKCHAAYANYLKFLSVTVTAPYAERRARHAHEAKLDVEAHRLRSVMYLPEEPEVNGKNDDCRQQTKQEQDTVFLEISERDQRYEDGGKDVAERNWH